MSISCPMAFSNHGDGRDGNKSFSVTVTEDTSVGRCFSGNCGIKGAFWWIIRESIKGRGSPSNLMDWLETVMAKERPDFVSRCKRIERFKPEFEELSINTRSRMGKGSVDERELEKFKPLTDLARRYLDDRGFDEQDIEEWELLWDADKRRIVFPVRRLDGRLVGFSGRSISSNALTKWLCYEGLVKTDHLFGEHRLKPGCIPVIVEGQPDAVITMQAVRDLEEPYVAVAPLGAGFSETQIETLRSLHPKRVIIFPDGDDAGEVWAGKVYRMLKRDIPLLAQPVEYKSDPGDMFNEEIVEALSNAKTIMKEVKLEVLEGKRKKRKKR